MVYGPGFGQALSESGTNMLKTMFALRQAQEAARIKGEAAAAKTQSDELTAMTAALRDIKLLPPVLRAAYMQQFAKKFGWDLGGAETPQLVQDSRLQDAADRVGELLKDVTDKEDPMMRKVAAGELLAIGKAFPQLGLPLDIDPSKPWGIEKWRQQYNAHMEAGMKGVKTEGDLDALSRALKVTDPEVGQHLPYETSEERALKLAMAKKNLAEADPTALGLKTAYTQAIAASKAIEAMTAQVADRKQQLNMFTQFNAAEAPERKDLMSRWINDKDQNVRDTAYLIDSASHDPKTGEYTGDTLQLASDTRDELRAVLGTLTTAKKNQEALFRDYPELRARFTPQEPVKPTGVKKPFEYEPAPAPAPAPVKPAPAPKLPAGPAAPKPKQILNPVSDARNEPPATKPAVAPQAPPQARTSPYGGRHGSHITVNPIFKPGLVKLHQWLTTPTQNSGLGLPKTSATFELPRPKPPKFA